MDQWIDVEPEYFLGLVKAGELKRTQIIDVREQEEWDYYHLEQSELIPLQTIPARFESSHNVEETLYVICAHGIRSMAACRYLSERGYRNLRNVVGGMAAVASLNGFQYD